MQFLPRILGGKNVICLQENVSHLILGILRCLRFIRLLCLRLRRVDWSRPLMKSAAFPALCAARVGSVGIAGVSHDRLGV